MIRKIKKDAAKTLTILAPISMDSLKLVTEMCDGFHSEVVKEFNMNITLNIVKNPEDEFASNTHLHKGTILMVDSKSQIIDIEKHIKQFIVGALMTAINKYERK